MRVARVVGEHQERAAVRDHAAVQRHAVHDRAHAELAHAVVKVVAGRIVAGERLRILAIGVVRAGEVGRAAEQLGHARPEGIQRLLRRLARRERSRSLARSARRSRCTMSRHARGQLALHASLVLGSQLRERCAVGVETLAPLPFQRGAALARIPVAANVVRNHERLVRPVELACARRRLRRRPARRRASPRCPACSAHRSR